MRLLKTITAPESLADVSMDSLIRYLKCEEKTERGMMLKAFELFLDIPKDLVFAMPYEMAAELFNDLLQNITVSESQPIPLRRTFKIGKTTYGIIPNFDKISLGEYADLDTFITPLYEGEIKHEDAFRFMACLYRPVTWTQGHGDGQLHRIEKYTGSEDWRIMKDAPADVYLAAVSFFLRLRAALLTVSRAYLKKMVEKMETQTKDPSNRSRSGGDGMQAFTALQKVTSLKLTQLAKHYSPKPLHFLAMKQNKPRRSDWPNN